MELIELIKELVDILDTHGSYADVQLDVNGYVGDIYVETGEQNEHGHLFVYITGDK